jgi:hypothetical protein
VDLAGRPGFIRGVQKSWGEAQGSILPRPRQRPEASGSADAESTRAILIIVPATLGDFSHGRSRNTLKKKESSFFVRVFPWPRAGMMSEVHKANRAPV